MINPIWKITHKKDKYHKKNTTITLGTNKQSIHEKKITDVQYIKKIKGLHKILKPLTICQLQCQLGQIKYVLGP
jgi:hypothetical protein